MCGNYGISFAVNMFPSAICPHRGSALRPNAMADVTMVPLDEERTFPLRMASAIDVVAATDIQAVDATMAGSARKALHYC